MKIVVRKFCVLFVCFLTLNSCSIFASGVNVEEIVEDLCDYFGIPSSTNNNNLGLKIDDNDFKLLSNNLEISKSYYQRLRYFKTTDSSILETRENIFKKFNSVKEKIERDENNVFGNKQKKELKEILNNNDLFGLTVQCLNITKSENFQDSKELYNLHDEYFKKLEEATNKIYNLLEKIET